MSKDFSSSKNKDIIRSTYDAELVRQEFDRNGKKLTYLGLPGWRMLDIIEWKEYLKSFVAFEEKPLLAMMLLLTAFRNQFEAELTLYEEEIDQALINHSREGSLSFDFEVINMDYEGGMVYKDLKEGSKRVQALEALLSAQAKQRKDFLLFLTLNVRKNDKGEIDTVVERILKENGITSTKILGTIATQPVAVKYKIYVPHLIKRVAEANHLDCFVHYPIRYAGTEGKSVMVHFAFNLRFNRRISAITPSQQTMAEVLDLEIFEARDGRISTSGIRFP